MSSNNNNINDCDCDGGGDNEKLEYYENNLLHLKEDRPPFLFPDYWDPFIKRPGKVDDIFEIVPNAYEFKNRESKVRAAMLADNIIFHIIDKILGLTEKEEDRVMVFRFLRCTSNIYPELIIDSMEKLDRLDGRSGIARPNLTGVCKKITNRMNQRRKERGKRSGRGRRKRSKKKMKKKFVPPESIYHFIPPNFPDLKGKILEVSFDILLHAIPKFLSFSSLSYSYLGVNQTWRRAGFKALGFKIRDDYRKSQNEFRRAFRRMSSSKIVFLYQNLAGVNPRFFFELLKGNSRSYVCSSLLDSLVDLDGDLMFYILNNFHHHPLVVRRIVTHPKFSPMILLKNDEELKNFGNKGLIVKSLNEFSDNRIELRREEMKLFENVLIHRTMFYKEGENLIKFYRLYQVRNFNNLVSCLNSDKYDVEKKIVLLLEIGHCNAWYIFKMILSSESDFDILSVFNHRDYDFSTDKKYKGMSLAECCYKYNLEVLSEEVIVGIRKILSSKRKAKMQISFFRQCMKHNKCVDKEAFKELITSVVERNGEIKFHPLDIMSWFKKFRVCSYEVTRQKKYQMEFYLCETCNRSKNEKRWKYCCYMCKKTCHKNHKFEKGVYIWVQGYCRCCELGKCKCRFEEEKN